MNIADDIELIGQLAEQKIGQLQQRIAHLEQQLAANQNRNEALQVSEAKLRQIMDSLPVMIGYVDLNQRIVLANRHIENWYQLSREELTGMQLRELFTEEHYQTVEELLDQVLSGQEVNKESVITYPDGVRRNVHLNYIPDIQDNTVKGYYFLVRDISERKQAEQQLKVYNEELDGKIKRATKELQCSNCELHDEIRMHKRTEEKLRANQEWFTEALESMTDGFLLFDSEGSLVAYNSKVHQLFPSLGDALKPGAEFRELLRISAEAGDVKEAVGRVEDWLDERMEKYPSDTGSLEVQISDGRWILATDRPTATNGVVSLRTDITDRKHTQEKIRLQQEQMASVMRRASMGEMASALAHEISQPLAAITNFSRGSLRRLEHQREQIPDVIEALERASQEAERAKSIIRHVSDFVRQSTPSVKEYSLRELVDAVLELSEASLRRNGIRCSSNIADQQIMVSVNRIEIEQVLFNLIRNSIDALKQLDSTDKTILVKGAFLSGQGCILSVIDNGEGIDSTIADRIFEPYVTSKAMGLGMGLSISRTIVESHGGQLRLDPQVDSGTRVTFNIPDARITDSRLDFKDSNLDSATPYGTTAFVPEDQGTSTPATLSAERKRH